MPPTKGRIVLVTTPGQMINGQDQHAAIVTQVWGTDDYCAINVTIFPGSGSPFTKGSVLHRLALSEGDTTSPYWDWPPRV